MANSTKSFARVAASSAAWGWFRHKSSMKNRKSFCHCERSEAISLHNSLFLVRHSIFTTTFFFLLLLFLIASPAYAKYGGGTGEPNDPYLIFDANQMNAIGADSNDWDKHFLLCVDIDLAGFTGTSFNIIGERYYDAGWVINPFTGVFDGNGHTISNFIYTSTDTDSIGLFGYIDDPNAAIKDLGLIAPDVDAGTENFVGSLVGFINAGTITGCYVEGGSVSGTTDVGGLVGYIFWGTITNSYATSSVSGGHSVGGVVGYNHGTISNCYSTGTVSGDYRVGGLVGLNDGTITNCYAVGSVTGDSGIGGLVGSNYHGTITNCYSASGVTGDDNVGGLVGKSTRVVQGSYWDTDTSGQTTSAGGRGKTTAEMQDPNTFMDAGWDFISQPDGPHDIWAEPVGGGYPILWWQLSPLPALPSFSGGSGTADDPYLISTPNDLNRIGHNPRLMRAHFKLIKDIDLEQVDFFIIGSEVFPFTGVFDGSGHTISNFTYDSNNTDDIGLFGVVGGESAEIKNLGLIAPNVNAGTGGWDVGALVGRLSRGTITNCYAEGGSVSGNYYVGGLVGYNSGTITNCYAVSSVSGDGTVGGLVGRNGGTITNCYSTGSVTGNYRVGGLVGRNWRTVYSSFWDIETSGQTISAGGTGKTTARMQILSTFTDAGWDFNTPIWTIDEGVDYPRLWWEWELAPVLHAEPELTLGTSNTITWEPVPGANDYYAECAADANFTSIVYATGWITETSYEFTGLQLGQRYWYSVKARNAAGVETNWSNVESSLQLTLADAVDMMLDPATLKNKNMKNALLNKINAVQQMLDAGRYEEALNKLQNDILQKTDGCAETGRPDKNDWIITCEEQEQIYPLVIETIEYVKGLMNQ